MEGGRCGRAEAKNGKFNTKKTVYLSRKLQICTMTQILRLIHTKRLHHKCYVDRQDGYATHSACHSARQKDQRWDHSMYQ